MADVAAAIVERAQQQIAEAQHERKRKAEELKRKNKIGRRF
jgi:hypothetical protein